MTTPNPQDPTRGAYQQPSNAPIYIDPVTHQQLFMDPVTGQLRYEPVGPADPAAGGVRPANPGQLPAYPQPYPPSPYGYPYAPAPPNSTDGMAVASLVTSIAGLLMLFCYGIGAVAGIVGAVLGHVARGRIRRSGQDGAGLALAGIIIGWTATGLLVAFGVIFLAIALPRLQ
ncbi:MAG TPA: DUF4190 domain-containing protein [Micromonosporaceae bacterium]|jgi:hypothetical protein|nr:DUF4190 domain-containing protein [Micromonosporaceae bacterium]